MVCCTEASCTYGRVQVDEDRAGDIFATASLSEEGLKRATLTDLFGIGVGTAVGFEAVLKEVSWNRKSASVSLTEYSVEDVQLPSAVTKLCAGLADVEVADL